MLDSLARTGPAQIVLRAGAERFRIQGRYRVLGGFASAAWARLRAREDDVTILLVRSTVMTGSGGNGAPSFGGAIGISRGEEGNAIVGPQRNRIQTRLTPTDSVLAERQWAEWRATRRCLARDRCRPACTTHMPAPVVPLKLPYGTVVTGCFEMDDAAVDVPSD